MQKTYLLNLICDFLKQGLIAENQFCAITDQIISAAMARASASEIIHSSFCHLFEIYPPSRVNRNGQISCRTCQRGAAFDSETMGRVRYGDFCAPLVVCENV